MATKTSSTVGLATRLAQAGTRRDATTGALSMPIYQSASFAHTALGHSTGFDYSRTSNPTRLALEETLAHADGGCRAFAFASGMAAISSTLMLFKPGDHLIAGRDIYGGSYRVLTTLFNQWGLEVSFVDATNPDNVLAALRPTTRGIFVETPANPLLAITDLAAIGAIAREHDLLAITDNTFMSPFLQRPLALGFDIVLHSATKFLGGHSDLIADFEQALRHAPAV